LPYIRLLVDEKLRQRLHGCGETDTAERKRRPASNTCLGIA
jgi:hypothetical protein